MICLLFVIFVEFLLLQNYKKIKWSSMSINRILSDVIFFVTKSNFAITRFQVLCLGALHKLCQFSDVSYVQAD